MADRQQSGHWGFDPGGFFYRLPKRVMSIALLTLQTSWNRHTFVRRGVFHDTVRSFVLALEGQPFATVRVDDRATVWRGADLDWTAARPSGHQRALDTPLPALTADTQGSVACNRTKAQLGVSRSESSPSQPCAFTSHDLDRATHRAPVA